jgi:hypothetical protein
MRKNLFAIGG